MEIDATSSGSSDSNPGFYGDNLFFPSLVGKRDFDAYFCQKRNSGDEKCESVSDFGKKVEEFVEVNNRKSSGNHQQSVVGFYSNTAGGNKKGGESNEIQLNSVNGFGKKTISFSPDQVRMRLLKKNNFFCSVAFLVYCILIESSEWLFEI